MDDIYDNLENYDDLNKIDELQNENQKLKCQIEEYTTAIDQLQKNILQDFDKLATEHKKLELNYSSLLKTAKAEIERKTQMIKELNIEKDKLVLNARQNVGNNVNKYRRSERIKSKNETGSELDVQVQLEGLNSKNHKSQNESKNANHHPTDPVSHCKVINNGGKYSENKNSNNEIVNYMSKENDMQVLNKVQNRHTESKLKRISNRRKSMPVLSLDMRFSSDDECENNTLTTEENKMHYQRRGEVLKQFVEKSCHNTKMSETSSVENNYSHYHEPLPSNYTKNKSDWNYANDKHRSRDKFESQKHRRNFSPDRSYQRGGKDYTDNYHQKYDYNDRRVYESPPRDKYHRSKSRDRRSHYEGNYTQNFAWHWSDNERYGEKHKLQDVADEPKKKRKKHEHSHRHIEDGKRWQQDIDINKGLVATPLELTEHISCQSPDYVHVDNYTTPVKEIMNTAVMHLEDPRLTSNKYKIVNDSNKEVLTVIGRNVDIVPIDKTLWGFKPVPIPKALLEPPTCFTAEIVKNTSLDIGNPTSKLPVNLVENSGADHSSIASSSIVEHGHLDNDITKKHHNNIIEHGFKPNIQTSTEICSNELSGKQLGNKYKIPKLLNNSEVKHEIKKASNISNNNFAIDKNDMITAQEIEKESSDDNLIGKSKSMPQLNNFSKSAIEVKKDIEFINTEKRKHDESRIDECTTKRDNREFDLSTRVVEYDLILSDETSDIMEPEIKIYKKKKKLKTKKDKIEVCDEKQKNKLEPKKSVSDCKTQMDTDNTIENKDNQTYEIKEQIALKGTIEPNKRHKIKKQVQENKACNVIQPKTSKSRKGKKEKESKTQEIKTKFSDLFGDSSSLITPDDLGLVTPETELKEKYDTLFEDTQDAVDLKIKEIENVQTSKAVCDNSENNSVKEQVTMSKPISDTTSIKDSNCKDEKCKTNQQIIKTKSSEVEETADEVNIYDNCSSETSNVAKTIIISTGMQSQISNNNCKELAKQPVSSVENVDKPIINLALKALATSTPAKVLQQEQSQTDSIRLPDCSSTNSTDSKIIDSPQTANQSSETNIHTQKDIDVPDVRIFVKRRRKVKRLTQ